MGTCFLSNSLVRASQTQAQYYSSPHLQPTHLIAPQPLTTTPQISSIPSYYTPHPNPNLHIHPPISPNSSHEPLVVHSHLWRARCKQVALESTAATGGVKKHRRFRLGTTALRYAGKCQKRKELLMRNPQFQLLLGEMAQGFKTDLRLHSQPKTIGKPQGRGKFDSLQQSSTPESISATTGASSSLISANDGSQVDMSVKFGSMPPSSVELTAATTNGGVVRISTNTVLNLSQHEVGFNSEISTEPVASDISTSTVKLVGSPQEVESVTETVDGDKIRGVLLKTKELSQSYQHARVGLGHFVEVNPSISRLIAVGSDDMKQEEMRDDTAMGTNVSDSELKQESGEEGDAQNGTRPHVTVVVDLPKFIHSKAMITDNQGLLNGDIGAAHLSTGDKYKKMHGNSKMVLEQIWEKKKIQVHAELANKGNAKALILNAKEGVKHNEMHDSLDDKGGGLATHRVIVDASLMSTEILSYATRVLMETEKEEEGNVIMKNEKEPSKLDSPEQGSEPPSDSLVGNTKLWLHDCVTNVAPGNNTSNAFQHSASLAQAVYSFLREHQESTYEFLISVDVTHLSLVESVKQTKVLEYLPQLDAILLIPTKSGLKLANNNVVCSSGTQPRAQLLSWFILFFELDNCEQH